ncbi:MAG: beta-ketoacyl synthase N-terminal-like domain-containing protein, partial [Bosea sp. (in: a-proteobacteria)]
MASQISSYPALQPAQGSAPANRPAAAAPAPLAIVGLSGRYPKSPDLDALWDNLKQGRDCVGEVDGSRWDLGFHTEGSHSPQRIYTKAGGFLDRIDLFDADFFGMSPREARQVDPQHRLLLELAWEAMESAGIVPASLAGSRTGVFVGVSANDYATMIGHSPDAYTNIGSALSIAANRISYIFDLHGPSMSIDTACSSSLVALHQACRSILAGDCGMALVGGVNILGSMKPFAGFAQASMLSPDGRCKSFDADGKGYVRAEGGGVVIVKPLADAERDGDEILAVILATAVNSDGRTMGLALPSGEAQEALLRQIYETCGIAPEDVYYVEAHGTGTAAGDPIECGAIARVLGEPRADASVCLIGSVKSNIGHLESGAGMAGLTKVLLSLRHGEIPANLHFNTPNPKIDFAAGRISVVDTPHALPQRAAPLIFGVNSFGFGGTNAHVVLQEYRRPETEAAAATQPRDGAEEGWGALLALSAQSPESLDRMVALNAAALEALPEAQWRDYRAAAALRRARHQHRLVIAASSAREAASLLAQAQAGESPVGVARARAAGAGRIAFCFSGNGPQWWGMGRELLARSAIFRDEIGAIDAVFAPLAGWSLIEMMSRPQADVPIALTEIAQPLLFAQQVALCAVLRCAGVAPELTFGHSVGEVAAAHVAGALSREQATLVIFQRSRLQALTAGRGRMAALSLSEEEAKDKLAGQADWLEIAAVNAPKAVTVAGEAEALQRLCDALTDEGRFARMLPLNYAFHTSAMDEIEAPLRAALAALAPVDGAIPFISTVAGEAVPGSALDAGYWWRNIRAPVRFDAAARQAITEHGCDIVLEIGPHPVLRDYVVQIAKANERPGVAALSTLRRPTEARPAPEAATLQNAICAVYAAGGGDWSALYQRPARPPKLPPYPWNRSVHWRGGWEMPDAFGPTARDHILLGVRAPGVDGLWTNTIQDALHGYLLEHVVQGSAIFPAAGYVELALQAALASGEGVIDFEFFEILKPLVLGGGAEPIVQLALDAADGTVRIRSRSDAQATSWTEHARGRITRPDQPEQPAALDLAALRAALPAVIDREAHYRGCARRGLVYGPHFQGVVSLALSEPDAQARLALGEIDLPQLAGEVDDYRVHPAVLDGCLQLLISIIAQTDPGDCATIPVQVGRVRSFAPLPARVVCQVRLLHENARTGVADFTVADETGRVLLLLEEARFQKVEFRPSALPILTEDWRPDPAWPVRQPAPLALPALGEIVARLQPRIQALAADGERIGFAAAQPGLDLLAAAYAAAAIRGLASVDRPFTLSALAREARIVAERLPALRTLLAMAVAQGWLQRGELGAEPVHAWAKDAAPPDPEALRQDLMLAHPGCGAELIAMARAGQALPRWLAGACEFPAVAMQEALEDTAPTRLTGNRIVAEAVRDLIAAWPQQRAIRVVELGGATGGLAAAVLPLLPPARSDYLFTDRCEQAVARASNRFAPFHYFRAKAAMADDLAETGFDLAIVSGDGSVAALAHLLTPGGVAILLLPQAGRLAELLTLAQPALAPEAVTAALLAAGLEVSPPLTERPEAPYAVLLARRPAADRTALPASAPALAGHRALVVGPAEAESRFVTALAEALGAAGQSVSLHRLEAEGVTDAEMAAIVASQPQAVEFVHLAGFAETSDAFAGILARQDMRCLTAIQLARAIELRPVDDAAPAAPATLTVVTRGAFATPAGAPPLDPFQATVAGVTRVIANEQVAVGCRLIDVHAAPDDVAAAQTLADALLARDAETETLLVDGRRYLHRTRESSIAEQTRLASFLPGARRSDESRSFRLDFLPGGGVGSLHLRESERRAPQPGEVEIAVRAAGLNFRDVLWTMGMLPEEAVEKGFSGPTIGMECAGEVVRTGPGVSRLKVGDRVIAFASSCFASHVTTSADSAALIPAGLGFAEAATIPTAFVTAWYALDQLARLEPGESVLIHGAAGGVGLAALQIARLKGAVIFATAGSEDKQRLVRTMGADHVLSSRSLAFADDIMRLTGGKGVDAVLNSLAGEAIAKGLQALKPFGRFLEIGKRDLYANSRIGLRPFRQNLSYFGIDADTLLVERPELAQRVFARVVAAMQAGEL